MRDFLLEVFLGVLVLPEQLLVVGLEVAAELAEELDEFVEALGVVDGLGFVVEAIEGLLGLVVVDG